MSFILAPEALADLKEIQRYIAEDNPRAAVATLDRLDGIMQRLANGALQGPETRLLDGRRVQGWSMPPYRIYYRRAAEQTVILRVYHQARRPVE